MLNTLRLTNGSIKKCNIEISENEEAGYITHLLVAERNVMSANINETRSHKFLRNHKHDLAFHFCIVLCSSVILTYPVTTIFRFLEEIFSNSIFVNNVRENAENSHERLSNQLLLTTCEK